MLRNQKCHPEKTKAGKIILKKTKGTTGTNEKLKKIENLVEESLRENYDKDKCKPIISNLVYTPNFETTDNEELANRVVLKFLSPQDDENNKE